MFTVIWKQTNTVPDKTLQIFQIRFRTNKQFNARECAQSATIRKSPLERIKKAMQVSVIADARYGF